MNGLVDEQRDLIVYACEPCGRKVGSPMPSGMRCLECRRPMPPVRTRPSPDAPWSGYKPPVPLQPTLDAGTG